MDLVGGPARAFRGVDPLRGLAMATVIGIDVSKASLDMAVHGTDLVVRYSNTSGGISKLINRLKALKASRVVVEATGGYETRGDSILGLY